MNNSTKKTSVTRIMSRVDRGSYGRVALFNESENDAEGIPFIYLIKNGFAENAQEIEVTVKIIK